MKRKRWDDDWYQSIEDLERQYNHNEIAFEEYIAELKKLQDNRPKLPWWLW